MMDKDILASGLRDKTESFKLIKLLYYSFSRCHYFLVRCVK